MEVDGQRLEHTVSKLCEPCQEGNVSTQADGYCKDCGEYMCQACFQSHVKIKVLRNHVLGALDGGIRPVSQKPETTCKKHTAEVIKYYCRNHDFVGCGHCLVFDHRKCEPELIEDLAKNLKESPDFKNIFKEVDNLESLKTEIEVSLEKNRNDNTEFHDKAVRGIQKYRAEISSWLDNVTAKIETEEMEIWNENEMVLSKLEDWIKIIKAMIDKVRDEVNTEKYTGENLFIRMIECKSEVSEFATKNGRPEIKSNLDIKPFAFEPNQTLCVFTKSANLGIIRLGNGTTEFSQRERGSDVTGIDDTSSVASFNLPADETEAVGTGYTCTFDSPEDLIRIELEKELEELRKITSVEKKEKEILQQELVDKESLFSREREKYVLEMKEHEQKIIVLKQEVSTLNDSNRSLKSKLDSCNKEFDNMESTFNARQEQDHKKIKSLQSDLKNISENHEKERKRLSSQIQDLQSKSAQKTYQLPDHRAAVFDVGRRVEHMFWGWTGTVTAVDPSGFVGVKWDNGAVSHRMRAGAEGEYQVKLL